MRIHCDTMRHIRRCACVTTRIYFIYAQIKLAPGFKIIPLLSSALVMLKCSPVAASLACGVDPHVAFGLRRQTG